MTKINSKNYWVCIKTGNVVEVKGSIKTLVGDSLQDFVSFISIDGGKTLSFPIERFTKDFCMLNLKLGRVKNDFEMQQSGRF